jgi:type 1 glutamine amidotransferase
MNVKRSVLAVALCAAAINWSLAALAQGAAVSTRKIVLVAGPPSHGPGEHEHRAGCLLLQKCLNQVPGINAVVVSNGWPADVTVFDGAKAIVIYSDGGDGHPFIQDDRLKTLGAILQKGVGFGAIHYAVEVPASRGGGEFLRWNGGYFEANWSVNPTWTADFTKLPTHPITRGVEPYKIYDEWYFHMRFTTNMAGLTPILVAVAPASTMDRPDGPHEGNPAVREEVKNGVPQVMMWAYEPRIPMDERMAKRYGLQPHRGFGFTGGHYHKNWGDENSRRLVLNAILWIAGADVPANGVQSTITADDLKANLDPKGR